ncbi:unnamed protein product [Closterium sp. NIES-64]|nr:unnamed protein product [Closterium sp. NIES-64]
MDAARTSMMHAAAPHFLWPFAVQYAAHQLNVQPRVSLPETSPALRWTGKVGNASAFRFYHPTSRRVLSSQDVTFDESVPYYRLFPTALRPLPPLPLFLPAPGPPPVEPLPPQGPALSGMSQGVLSLGVLSLGVLSLGVLSLGVLSLGVLSLGVRSLGALGLLVWPPAVLRRGRSRSLHRSCASGLPAAGDVLLQLGVLLGLLELVLLKAAGGASPAGAGAAGGVGAGVSTGAGASGVLLRLVVLTVLLELVLLELELLGVLALAVLLALVLLRVLELALLELELLLALVLLLGYWCRLAERREPASVMRRLFVVLALVVVLRVPRPPAVPGTHLMALRPSTAPLRVPLPSPPESSLPSLADPESVSLHAASPSVTRLLATVVTDPSFESTTASALVAELVNFAARCRLDYAASLVAESESGDPDAPDIPTPRSYVEAIEGPYSSQWQSAMDAEMASWKSTGTYVDEVPPPGANIVSGMWIFRVKRPPGSPHVFKARYMARGFSERQGVDYFQNFSPTQKMTTLRVLLHIAAQRDYELHSLDFSTAFLQGSLHEEMWLRRPHLASLDRFLLVPSGASGGRF